MPVYLPHVVAVGQGVIGYLPGYLREDGYNSGRRLILVGTFLPHPADTVVALVLLAVAAWWTWLRSDPSAPEHAATIMTGIAFLVIAPSDGWYAAMLIALAIMSARYEWIILALAPAFVYLTSLALLSYTLGAIGTAFAWRVRTVHESAALALPGRISAGFSGQLRRVLWEWRRTRCRLPQSAELHHRRLRCRLDRAPQWRRASSPAGYS